MEYVVWFCMVGNLKKWKDGLLCCEMIVKGFLIMLIVICGECCGISYWIDFWWDNLEVIFVDIFEVFGELFIFFYFNWDMEESDKEIYQIVYLKIKGLVVVFMVGLYFIFCVLDVLIEKGIDFEELIFYVGVGIFKLVKSEEIEGYEMYMEYIFVLCSIIKKLIDYDVCVIVVGIIFVCIFESFYYIGVILVNNLEVIEE